MTRLALAIAPLLLATACERQSAPTSIGQSQSAAGAAVYSQHCASCHGANLEGQPNWRERRPDGKLPAPPHDASGHTWHHADEVLFDLVKNGMARYAGPDYATDMPAYAGALADDEIRAVLEYIKSRWPADIREKQAGIDAAHRAAR